jgi:seryl-tRNA synthetase
MPKGIPGSGTPRAKQALSPAEIQARRAELEAKRAALQAEHDQLEAQDKERYAAIGKAVEKHADTDPEFAKKLRDILERNVTDRGERVCLGLEEVKRRGRPAKQAADATLPSAAAMPTVSE